ncbi:HdeD family acid-resistance protein [Chitinophaga silvisoli]|uniref:HdeD family acid-resistance protein n=1 Tax=Chitinophaga silvisoli TaxID=2291814 RepID=A0A3E1NU78_9BACT|nr:DUF308 domain-containing protein [Chitinophaga silvisoli]RFM31505.1 hypothetical protein DXN04_27675 [Chitinophaga silvisoli]
MNHIFRHYWGLAFVIGLLFMLAGAGMAILPFGTYYALSLLLSITFIVGGTAEIVMGIRKDKLQKSSGWRIAGGITDLIIGVIIYPEFSFEGLSYLLAISLMFRSVMMMMLSFSLRLYDGIGWFWLMGISILSMLLSLLLLWNPIITGFTIGLFTGMAFFGVGLFIFLFSFRLRKAEIIYAP